MSTVSWITPKGTLGTVPESRYYQLKLNAIDSDEQSLFYSFISGELPPGVYVTRDGYLRGIPTITSRVGQTVIYTFTVRATNPNGTVSDRSFSLTVSNTAGPEIVLNTDLIGAWFDGNYVDYQFESINENPTAVSTWSINSGSLPDGVTLSSDGLLSGYVSIIAANTNQIGYDVAPEDSTVYDAPAKSTDKYYNFTIQATDGFKITSLNVRMLIVSKGSFTTDNQITVINNTFIRVDADNRYRPIILNAPDSLPTLISGDTFFYQFLAYDPEDEPISWTIDELAYSGMDQLDAAATQDIIGNGTVGPYTLNQSVNPTLGAQVFYNGTLLVESVDYTIVATQLTFTVITPAPTELVEVLFLSGSTGYDSLLFDQGASGLPAGLTINQTTGWVYGVLPLQAEDVTTYDFKIIAYRTLTPEYKSDPVTFKLNVKRTLNEEIIWDTAADLGLIDNGAVSELAVKATNTLGKELEYSIIYDPYRKIPQGLKFLSSGRFTGRTSFRYFSLDGAIGLLNVLSTANLEVGMSVQGPGVASGCKITAIVNDNTIEIRPAIYVSQGTTLTFTSQTTTEVATTTSNAITTVIDNGKTTFDQVCKFTVQATAIDNTISATKTFTVTINPYNLAPYENLYLRALPSESQRALYNSVTTDSYIFPTNLVYRPDDPLFGVSKTFKFLFMAGLSPATAETYVNSIQNNHYTKTINFGDVKTAVAKNANGGVDYEVVYVEALDSESYGTKGPPLSLSPPIANGYLYGNQEYKTIYPNSFINMQKRLNDSIGFTNRGAIPRWMTTIQSNGLVLGMINAIVLAYVVPGASELVKYRLYNSALINTGNFSFVADRYQLDNSLSKYYDITTNSFVPSRQTTFDKYATAQTRITEITTSIESDVVESYTITVPTGIAAGIGWKVVNKDLLSTIKDGTTITKIIDNVLTLSLPVTASVGAVIHIIPNNQVDYAVSVPFDYINGQTVTHVRDNLYMDGVSNFANLDTLIFANQAGFPEEPNNGWNDNGTVVPGYLDKLSLTSYVNKQGGTWIMNWIKIPTLVFDDDSVGFDGASTGLANGYYDQGEDNEINLEFTSEILLNQAVKIRSGKSYPNSILVYQTAEGQSVPSYFSINNIARTAETTFDGGSCVCREKDIQSGKRGIAGGTQFTSDVDKYIVPESLDKYIKFPQTGVFV